MSGCVTLTTCSKALKRVCGAIPDEGSAVGNCQRRPFCMSPRWRRVPTEVVCPGAFSDVMSTLAPDAARLGCGSAAASSAPERRVHRLLSFQRYLHSSRLLRGLPQQIPLHILDEDYAGQARVRQLPPPPPPPAACQFSLCLDSLWLTLTFPALQCMLEKVGNWNFDIFLFDKLTNGESVG